LPQHWKPPKLFIAPKNIISVISKSAAWPAAIFDESSHKKTSRQIWRDVFVELRWYYAAPLSEAGLNVLVAGGESEEVLPVAAGALMAREHAGAETILLALSATSGVRISAEEHAVPVMSRAPRLEVKYE
jgi:hypothetical protein